MMLRPVSIAFALFAMLALIGCSPTEEPWRPDTKWRSEKITEDTASFLGSYQNALDTLRIRSNEWKLIECNLTTNQCEWGFKLVIEFPDHPGYSPMKDKDGKVLGVSIMPISKIEYKLFDKDEFHLTTLTMSRDDLHVEEKETRAFQYTGLITLSLARRAHHGKVNISAGYVPQRSR